jgi:hypothetical protein
MTNVFLTKTQEKAALRIAIGVPPKQVCNELHVTAALLKAWLRQGSFRGEVAALKKKGFTDAERLYYKTRRVHLCGKLVRR